MSNNSPALTARLEDFRTLIEVSRTAEDRWAPEITDQLEFVINRMQTAMDPAMNGSFEMQPAGNSRSESYKGSSAVFSQSESVSSEGEAITVLDYSIKKADGQRLVRGKTIKKVDSTAACDYYDVINEQLGLRMTVRDARWANGERDIVAIERHETPERFDGLKNRLRMGVNPVPAGHDGWYIELMQAKLSEDRHRPTKRGASISELNSGSGGRIRDLLCTFGADEVAPRGELFGPGAARRNIVAALCTEDPILVPIIAYLLTRIAPIANGVKA